MHNDIPSIVGPDTAVLAETVEREAWRDFFAAAPEPTRQSLMLASASNHGMALLAAAAIPIVEMNRAMAGGSGGEPADTGLDAVIAWLDVNAAPGWAIQLASVPHNQDLRERLGARGLAPHGNGWAKFVWTAAAAPTAPAGVDVRLAGPADALAFADTVQTGFGLPAETAAWFAALVGRPAWSCYVVRVGGRIAAAAALFMQDGVGWLGMGTTLVAERGQGAQMALLARLIADAKSAGATLLTVETAYPDSERDPGAQSFRNCRRAGFEILYQRANLKRTESGRPPGRGT